MINQLKKLASEYAQTDEGKWLNDFDWDAVPVKFKPMGWDIVGLQFFGRIVLMEVADVNLIFDIYIHELRHVWQRKTQPLRYLAGKLFRKLIEDDADAEELKAFAWLNKRK